MTISNNTLEGCLVALYFISKVKKGDKIDTRRLQTQSAQSYVDCITRTLSGETRRDTINFIRLTLTNANDFMQKSKDEKEISEIKAAVLEAVKGLSNLEDTYSTDALVCANLTNLKNSAKQLVGEPL